MKSACLVAKQTPFVAGPDFVPNAMDTRVQEHSSSQVGLWRPWIVTNADAQKGHQRRDLSCPYSRPTMPSNTLADGKNHSFQHPVRLFWPKSKSYDYLYSDGEALLRNFPVQATISFYDESDSEDDEEDDFEEELDSSDVDCLKQPTYFTSYN